MLKRVILTPPWNIRNEQELKNKVAYLLNSVYERKTLDKVQAALKPKSATIRALELDGLVVTPWGKKTEAPFSLI